mgnify:CR=1 FL=1
MRVLKAIKGVFCMLSKAFAPYFSDFSSPKVRSKRIVRGRDVPIKEKSILKTAEIVRSSEKTDDSKK